MCHHMPPLILRLVAFIWILLLHYVSVFSIIVMCACTFTVVDNPHRKQCEMQKRACPAFSYLLHSFQHALPSLPWFGVLPDAV